MSSHRFRCRNGCHTRVGRTRNRSRRGTRAAAFPDGPSGATFSRSEKVGPAGLEPATSWFVAVNTFVDPAQLTPWEGSFNARHLDPILDPGFTATLEQAETLPNQERSQLAQREDS